MPQYPKKKLVAYKNGDFLLLYVSVLNLFCCQLIILN